VAAAVEAVVELTAAYLKKLAAQYQHRVCQQDMWSVTQAVWLSELNSAATHDMEICTHAREMLRLSKHTNIATFTTVAAMLMDFLLCHMHVGASCFTRRKAWLLQLGAKTPAASLARCASATAAPLLQAAATVYTEWAHELGVKTSSFVPDLRTT
jgi:hypothetical protein